MRAIVAKSAQRRLLNDAGVGAVARVDLVGGRPVPGDLDLPLPGVLKPALGAGSRDTSFVEQRDHVVAALAQAPAGEPFVLEARLPGLDNPLVGWLADASVVPRTAYAPGVPVRRTMR